MTADEKYTERLAKICEQLEQIKTNLESHVAKQSHDKTNWGYVGDLGAVSKKLAEIEEMFI